MFNKIMFNKNSIIKLAIFATLINSCFSMEPECEAIQVQPTSVKIMLINDYNNKEDAMICLQEENDGSYDLFSTDVIDDGTEPLYMKASNFLADNYKFILGLSEGVIGPKADTCYFGGLNLVVFYTSFPSIAGCAWPIKELCNQVRYCTPKLTITSWDNNGNQITVRAEWIEQIALALQNTNSDFMTYLR